MTMMTVWCPSWASKHEVVMPWDGVSLGVASSSRKEGC